MAHRAACSAAWALAPDIVVGGIRKHTLFVANDNDAIGTDSLHPTGVANPNLCFVFSVDPGDLPGDVPQRLAKTHAGGEGPSGPSLLDLVV